ncbi:MAG: DUF357 domain-containing protein [Candidatus ainarchaeum sp.]|nr:DUF357 domain-containing protein [Candidatus ainarchaeum sp.]
MAKKIHLTLQQSLEQKAGHYGELTKKALEKVEIRKGLDSRDEARAHDFLSMARNYFNDARHFEEKGELLLALAAFSYAHAWLDAGVRAKILDGKNDDRLFTLP